MEYFSRNGSVTDFIERHLLPNEPCLFGDWLTSDWGARRLWVCKDGKPDLHYLAERYGEEEVTVANCGAWLHSTHRKSDMILKDYIQYWQDVADLPPATPTSPATPSSLQGDPPAVGVANSGWDVGDGTGPVLYLKDWHFFKRHPDESGNVYFIPEYFTSDWLNEVWAWREDVSDDYKFVYMGPAGTWTPFHADVFRSYSWSANVCGVKEWLFYRPGQEELLLDRWGNLPCDVTSEDLLDPVRYPHATGAPPPLRVIQGPGEVIFVPSGWYHQVRNVAPTISINHNWSNAFCLCTLTSHLRHELKLVEDELSDCQAMTDWTEHCQVVLKACAGMDLWELGQFVLLVMLPRLQHFWQLLHCYATPSHDSSYQIHSHILTPLLHFVTMVTDKEKKLNFFRSGDLPQVMLDIFSSLKLTSADHTHIPHPCSVGSSSDARFIAGLGRQKESSNRELYVEKPGEEMHHTDSLRGPVMEGSDTVGPGVTSSGTRRPHGPYFNMDELKGSSTVTQSLPGSRDSSSQAVLSGCGILSALPPYLHDCIVMASPAHQPALALGGFELYTLTFVTQQLSLSYVT